MSESLPNILGTYRANGTIPTTGCFINSGERSSYAFGNAINANCLGFDASQSNEIYKNGSGVHPKTMTCNFAIRF